MVHSNIYEDKDGDLSGFSRNITIAFTAIAFASSGAALFSIWDAILGRQLPDVLSLGAILLLLRVSGIVIADYIGSSCFRHYDELVTQKQRKQAANLLGAYIGISALNLVVSLVLEAIYHNPEIRFPDGTLGAIQLWTFAGMPLQGVVMLIMGVGLRESDPAYKRLQAEKVREDIATQASFNQQHQQRMAELSRQATEIEAQATYYASNSYRAVVMRATQLKLLRQLETDPHVSADDIAFLQDAIPQLKGRGMAANTQPSQPALSPPTQLSDNTDLGQVERVKQAKSTLKWRYAPPKREADQEGQYGLYIGRIEEGCTIEYGIRAETFSDALQQAKRVAAVITDYQIVVVNADTHSVYDTEGTQIGNFAEAVRMEQMFTDENVPSSEIVVWTLDALLTHWNVTPEQVIEVMKKYRVRSAEQGFDLLKRYGHTAGFPLPDNLDGEQFKAIYAELHEHNQGEAVVVHPNGAAGDADPFG